ncbi:hypothetical protein LDENG_00166330 [Lucifuga dentata]|nr:hypothetical protein LDENG_00166330 [Lucifuga dentata]
MSCGRTGRTKPTTTSTTMMASPQLNTMSFVLYVFKVMMLSSKWTSNRLKPHQQKQMTWHYTCQWLGL